MLDYLKFIFVFSYLVSKCYSVEEFLGTDVITTKMFMFWPNATVPFFINPDHFDHEQAMAIMTSLSMFAFKTCIKFQPVMATPTDNQHVMVFINPDGTRRCKIETRGQSVFTPHLVNVGYECLQSPQIDMYIMRALGFPFEHNRMSRDVYIDVMIENIEPSAIGLFTKESVLPAVLRSLPYDINSVMHFGDREFSKNGHRTIIIKNPNVRQNRVGLSSTDIRKIEMVYSSECRARDRQEKIDICQSYPGVARRKREINPLELKSLRVNPDITPPPALIETTLIETTPTDTPLDDPVGLEETSADTKYISENLKLLGIEDEAQEVIEQVYKVSALALKHAREKYCNASTNITVLDFKFEQPVKKERGNSSDLLGILEIIADYAKTMVDTAVSNLTVFCENSGSIFNYQRACDWRTDARCPKTYRSTKHGPVRQSTQHRPTYKPRTKHEGVNDRYSYDKPAWRAGNATESLDPETDVIIPSTTPIAPVRRKREATETATTIIKEKKIKEKKILKEKKGQKEKGEKKDNLTNLKGSKIGLEPKDSNTVGTRRYFQEKRYKVKTPQQPGEGDWEASNVSIEKEGSETMTVREALNKREKEIEAERQREREKEKLKEIELAAEKLIDQEALGQDVIGADNDEGVDEKDEDPKSKDSKEGDEEKGLEIDKDVESKDEGKDVQKEVEKEVEKTVEKVEEEVEKTVEADIEPKEEKNQEEEVEEKQTLDVEVENPEEQEVKSEPKKGKGNMKQRKRSRGNLPTTVKLNKLNEEFYNERRWPDGQIIYVIKQVREYDLEDLRNRLAEVNSILEKKTCTKLREVGAKEADGYEDYLLLDTSPDYVTGRVGGKQIFGCVELFKGGQHRQHTAMMVMAWLGFYFEVSRHDRDKHIRVHMRHVRPDKLHHFEKIRDEATLDLPYDYKSATHPAWQFWRKIGKTGISTVATYKQHDPDGSIMRALGQNPQLFSDSDIIRINSIYGIDCFLDKHGAEKQDGGNEKGFVPIQKDNSAGEGTFLGGEKEVEKENEEEQENDAEKMIDTKEDVS